MLGCSLVRYWLIELPARIFDAWLLAYRVLTALIILTAMIGVTVALLLWLALGIRWGW